MVLTCRDQSFRCQSCSQLRDLFHQSSFHAGPLVSHLRGLLAKAQGTAADVRRALVAGDDGHSVQRGH